MVDERLRAARVVVPDYQLSLAIGREGQNARLAARLTGWRIDIRSDTAPARPRSGRCVESDRSRRQRSGRVRVKHRPRGSRPVRMCAGCRGRAEKAELIRFVARDGVGVVDPAQTAPGVGCTCTRAVECLDQAVKRRSMGRLLRAEIDGARTAEAIRVHLDAVT